MSDGGLFDGVFARGSAPQALTSSAWLRAVLDVEAALARAVHRAGLVSSEHRDAVVEATRAQDFDLEEISAAGALTGNPVPAVVEALARRIPREATVALHRGATSQDILDTAAMLLARRTGRLVQKDLILAMDAAAALAESHRGSMQVGRTLLQPAVPITFGLKAATWLTALVGAETRLADCIFTKLPVQFGGAAGTLASLGAQGVTVARFFAEELELAEPPMPWHTDRAPIVDVAGAFAGVAAAVGKIARDVTLLCQPEVDEVRERPSAERGGSSTMPHKQNPVGSVAVLACTRRVPYLAATLLGAAEQEHERAAGAWHAEWETLTSLMRLVGSSAAWTREVLAGLEVNPRRMAENLAALGGLPQAEHLVSLLAPKLGREAARTLMRDASLRARESARPLLDVLYADAAWERPLELSGMTRDAVAQALNPRSYLGSTDAWIDRALGAYRRRAETRGGSS